MLERTPRVNSHSNRSISCTHFLRRGYVAASTMRSPPSVLAFVAISAFIFAATATANGDYEQQQQQHGYEPPAYLKPVDGLVSGYYGESCPDMERIVQTAVRKAFDADYTVAAGLIRLFFHDFAVGGCDGSILIDGEGSEKHANASRTLRGFELIEQIKTEVEKKCPRKVSCADILTAAARDASQAVGVDYWHLKFGRKDRRWSAAAEADRYVPMGRESITSLLGFFESRGLNVLDLVVLSGAHTIGKASCRAVKPRLQCDRYGGVAGSALALDRRYGDFLRRKCHRDEAELVELDAETPTAFDNRYYQNLLRGMGLLETDQKLLLDSRTGRFVRDMASQPGLFKHQFSQSMKKLGEIQVLTADEGEVRLKCSAINAY